MSGARIHARRATRGLAVALPVALALTRSAGRLRVARAELAAERERFDRMFADSRLGMALSDSHGRWLRVNPALCDLLGYREDELVGHLLSEFIHADDAGLLTIRGSEDVHPAGGSGRDLEQRFIAKDGSVIWAQVTVSVTVDPVTRERFQIAQVHDITDRLAIEGERGRLDLERRVSHRLEAVGQLAAGIAHEINTPLQFVGDSVTFLREAADELLILIGRHRELLLIDVPIALDQRRAIIAEAEEHADLDYLCERIPAAFDRTADGVARVQSIVQAMKRFSHPSGAEVALADLNEAIETTLAVCRNEYKYVAEMALDLGELPLVPCNIGELNQVFLNLVINAAQAIDDARSADAPLGHIRISTSMEDGQAVIAVADDGPGIPPALQDRIYEPFYTTKEVGRGTGQGLALARATVQRHAGSLECTSAPGSGATFIVRLPLTVANAEPGRQIYDSQQDAPRSTSVALRLRQSEQLSNH